MNQNKGPKEPGPLCLKFPKLRPEPSCLYFWQIFTQTRIFMSVRFPLSSADFVQVKDLIDLLRGDAGTWLPVAGKASPGSALLRHTHPNANAITRSGRSGLNQCVPPSFWGAAAAERQMYRKETTVKEEDHRWSPNSSLIKIRSSNWGWREQKPG